MTSNHIGMIVIVDIDNDLIEKVNSREISVTKLEARLFK